MSLTTAPLPRAICLLGRLAGGLGFVLPRQAPIAIVVRGQGCVVSTSSTLDNKQTTINKPNQTTPINPNQRWQRCHESPPPGYPIKGFGDTSTYLVVYPISLYSILFIQSHCIVSHRHLGYYSSALPRKLEIQMSIDRSMWRTTSSLPPPASPPPLRSPGQKTKEKHRPGDR